jgi:hypothetical protein
MLILIYKVYIVHTGVVVHACNPSIWEAQAGGLKVQSQPTLHSEFWSQPGLHCETLSQKQNQKGIN